MAHGSRRTAHGNERRSFGIGCGEGAIGDFGLQIAACPGATVSGKMEARWINHKSLEYLKLFIFGLGQGLRIDWVDLG